MRSPALRAVLSVRRPALAVAAVLSIVACGDSGARRPEVSPSFAAELEPAVRRQFEETLERAQTHPDDGDALGSIAQWFDAYGYPERAALWYRRAREIAPEDPRWPRHRARLAAAAGDTAEAIAHARAATELEWDAWTSLLLVRLLRETRNLIEAEREARRILSAAPDDPGALSELARIAIERGELDAAQALAERARAAAPDGAASLHLLVAIATRRGDKATARRYSAELAKLSSRPAPDPIELALSELRLDTESLLRRAAARFKAGEFTAALALYERCESSRDDLTMLDYNIGFCLQRLGRTNDARARYRRFLSHRPESVDGWNHLGLCDLETGDLAAAGAAFDRALALDPNRPSTLRNRAGVAIRQRDFARASELLSRAMAQGGGTADERVELAALLHGQGDFDRALAQLAAALAAHPGHTAAREAVARGAGRVDLATDDRGLAAFLARREFHAAAISLLRQSVERGEWKSAVALAWLLATCPEVSLRSPLEAIAIVEPLCRGPAASDPVALDTLAAAYGAAKRWSDAVETAERAVELARSRAASASSAVRVEAMEARLSMYRKQIREAE